MYAILPTISKTVLCLTAQFNNYYNALLMYLKFYLVHTINGFLFYINTNFIVYLHCLTKNTMFLHVLNQVP